MRPTSRTTIPVQMRPLHEGRSEDKYLVEHAIQEELKLERHIKEVRAEHSSSHTSVIVMRELLVAALLIVAIAPLTPGLVLQYEETVVIQKTNLTLQSGESYWTTFTLEPYAPHTTESDIDPIDPSIAEPLIRIRIDSETHSKTILHRGDTRHSNSSFTPTSQSYTLNITNMGYIREISVNFTITQTGEPPTNLFPPERVLSEILLPVGLMVAIPLGALYGIIMLCKKRLASA